MKKYPYRSSDQMRYKITLPPYWRISGQSEKLVDFCAKFAIEGMNYHD